MPGLSKLRASVWDAWVSWTLFTTAWVPEWASTWREMQSEGADDAPGARHVSSTRWRGPRVKTLVDADTTADAVALVRGYAGTHAGGSDELLSTLMRVFLLFPPSERQVRAMTRAAELAGGGGLEDFCTCTVLMAMMAAADDLRSGPPRLPAIARARSFAGR